MSIMVVDSHLWGHPLARSPATACNRHPRASCARRDRVHSSSSHISPPGARSIQAARWSRRWSRQLCFCMALAGLLCQPAQDLPARRRVASSAGDPDPAALSLRIRRSGVRIPPGALDKRVVEPLERRHAPVPRLARKRDHRPGRARCSPHGASPPAEARPGRRYPRRYRMARANGLVGGCP